MSLPIHFKYRGITLLYLCLLSSQIVFAQNQNVNTYLRNEYTNKFERYFPVNPEVLDFIAITDTGVNMYASSNDKKVNKIEYQITWDELAVFRALVKQNPSKAFELYQQKKSPELVINTLKKTDEFAGWNNLSPTPLANLRIAIDPGHVGGDLETAKIERRFIEMKLDGGEKISFFEAELTYSTAKILQNYLEGLGATVFLTRKEPNLTAYGISYDEWYDRFKETRKEEGENTKNKKKVFEDFFKRDELEHRAKIINEFKPDLTLIIHYNAVGDNKAGEKPVAENRNLAFVGGGYLKDELNNPYDRFHLLRLLLTDDMENSIEFSKYVLDSFTTVLKVPVDENANKNNSMATEVKGVFARNLTLSSKVYGTLCYGESLYQNNEIECRLLNKKEDINGFKTSPRVLEVAEAYLQAVLNFVKTHY